MATPGASKSDEPDIVSFKEAALDIGLSWDESLKEPFLQLPAPLENYFIVGTLIHRSENKMLPEWFVTFLEVMNDDRVYPKLATVPHPYTLEHATAWISSQKQLTASTLACLAHQLDAPGELSALPIHAIRYRPSVANDETTWVGDIKFFAVKDSSFTWQVGYLLDPDHWSRGVMTQAVRSLLLLLKRIKARQGRSYQFEVQASAYKGNEASVHVLQKAGFLLKCSPEQDVDAKMRGTTPEYKLLYQPGKETIRN